ncbi:hypothetical protein [Elizabethkingia anophelis]|uniref:hypothetical protein n=1 Tax=Elizabethkingia anophelis TaxID=1117645 RepID=UPI00136D95A2|nr:hypothetical protein [Elizabethkingia anophelis]MYY43954.1 hypothetical protein [Elizabethkingia anophelis]
MYVKDGKIRVLSENAPDAAIQSLTAITAKANIIGKVDASAALNTQRTIAQLGKRTAAVNMLRDALYRLNEMYYATVDQQSELKKLLDSNKINQETYRILMTTNTGAGTKTLDKNELSEMFKLIIQETKAISIAEADAEKITVKAESDASIEKSKEQQKKHDAIIAVIQKMDGNLTKEKAEEYLKELIKN